MIEIFEIFLNTPKELQVIVLFGVITIAWFLIKGHK